jgi:sulfatase maturation enzyme AslB (radical SAM superfamily)
LIRILDEPGPQGRQRVSIPRQPVRKSSNTQRHETRLSSMSAKPELIDSFGRRIEYLRLSITDRCNYRCFYCMPASGVPHGQHRDFLRHEEFARLVRLFAGLGVRKLRLTGGEPLVRKGLVDLVALLHAIPGIEDLALSTNGHLLVRLAEALRRAGVSRVNISLDSLDADTFARITRGGDLDEVLHGIEAARAVGLDPVKLNMVVLRGVNDHEIEPMFVAPGAACPVYLECRWGRLAAGGPFFIRPGFSSARAIRFRLCRCRSPGRAGALLSLAQAEPSV